MLNVKITGQKEVVAQLNKIIQQSLTKDFMFTVGKMARDIVVKRTKSGFGVTDDRAANAKKAKLKPLSPGYIDFRKKNKPTGRFAAVTRSNLTYTGQLLEAIEVAARRNGFTITIASSGRSDSKLSNLEVGRFAGASRPFFNLTEDETKILVKKVRNQIRKTISKTLKTTNR